MGLQKVSLETISLIDGGKIALGFNELLDNIVRDCEERSSDAASPSEVRVG